MAVSIILALSLFGLATAFFYSTSIKKIPIDMGVEDPDIKDRLAKISSAIASGAMAFSNLAMYTTLLAVPMLLSQRAGWTSASIGMVLTSLAAASVIFTPLGARVADHVGRRWPVVGANALPRGPPVKSMTEPR